MYLLPRPSVWVVCTTRTLYTTISLLLPFPLPSLPLLLPSRPTETAGQRMSCGSNNYTQDCGSPKNCLQRPIPMHFSYRMDTNPSCIELYMQLHAVNCKLTLEYAILLRHIFYCSGYYQEFICYYKGRIKVRKTLLLYALERMVRLLHEQCAAIE